MPQGGTAYLNNPQKTDSSAFQLAGKKQTGLTGVHASAGGFSFYKTHKKTAPGNKTLKT